MACNMPRKVGFGSPFPRILAVERRGCSAGRGLRGGQTNARREVGRAINVSGLPWYRVGWRVGSCDFRSHFVRDARASDSVLSTFVPVLF